MVMLWAVFPLLRGQGEGTGDGAFRLIGAAEHDGHLGSGPGSRFGHSLKS